MVYSLAFVWISLWVRVVKPLQRWRRRWRVAEAREQPGDSLTIVLELVNTRAAEGWSGERGRVGEQVLAANLPSPHEQWQFFLCGPSAMMDSAESWLARDGVAAEQFHSERFMMA